MITDTLEIITLKSPSWMADALCGNGDFNPEWWFPGPGDTDKAEKATRICRGCPVRNLCLRWAYEMGDAWGILGGMTAKQRSRVRNRILRKKNSWAKEEG